MKTKLLPLLALSLLLAACSPVAHVDVDTGSGAVVAERYIAPECQVGGCSAQICQGIHEEPAVSDCMYRPIYECYKTARCEQQADGLCGWTMSSELSSCLLHPPVNPRV